MKELKQMTQEEQKQFNKRTVKGLKKIKDKKILDDAFKKYIPSIYKD